MATGTRKAVLIITLMLASIVAIGLDGILYRAEAYQERIKIIIPKNDAVSMLGVDSVSVMSATLSVPGYGIVHGAVAETEDKYEITFNITEIINIIINNKKKGHSEPTIVINIIDHDTRRVMTSIISSYTEYFKSGLLHIGNPSPWVAASIAAKRALEDPYYILKKDKIELDQDYMELLRGIGNLVITEIDTVSLSDILPRPVTTCSPPEDSEYPYPGTGIYQIVNHTLYYMLTHQDGESFMPEWWEKRFIDTPGYGYTAQEAYNKFVKDLYASTYLVSKEKYPNADEAVKWLRDYIAIGMRDDTRAGTNLILMEKYLRQDHWNNSMDGVVLRGIDLPILAYKISHELKDNDARKLTYDFDIRINIANGTWISGFLILGIPIAAASNPELENKTIKIIHHPTSFYNSSARFGVVLVRNVSVTFGPDYIIIDWEIDKESCSDYYIIRPNAFISPIHTIYYNMTSNTFEKIVLSDGDPLDYARQFLWVQGMHAEYESVEAGTDPNIDHSVLFYLEYMQNGGIIGNTTYIPLLDIIPLLSPILNILLKRVNNPLITKIIIATYVALATSGILSTSVQTTQVAVEFRITQDAPLSKEASVDITMYEAKARKNAGFPSYSVFIYVDAYYTGSGGGPGCGPSWCPISNSSS